MTSEHEGSGPYRDSRPPHLWHIPSAEALGYEVPPLAVHTSLVVRSTPDAASEDGIAEASAVVAEIVEKLACDPAIADDAYITLDQPYRPEG